MKNDSLKTILITGASRGIGAATALLAGKSGYAVVVNYLNNGDRAGEIVARITELGGKARAIQADISKPGEILRLFSEVDNVFGPLHGLVNNAGILESQMRLDQMDVDRLVRICETNIIGTLLCAKEAVKRMSTNYGGTGGSIVNLSSTAAKLGAANEYIDYAASKGAIESFTIGLANEVANEGIRVNAVRPGLIYTDIHADGGEKGRVDRLKSKVPLQRGGTSEEVAEAIMWLISDKSSFTTGTFIDVSGGL